MQSLEKLCLKSLKKCLAARLDGYQAFSLLRIQTYPTPYLTCSKSVAVKP